MLCIKKKTIQYRTFKTLCVTPWFLFQKSKLKWKHEWCSCPMLALPKAVIAGSIPDCADLYCMPFPQSLSPLSRQLKAKMAQKYLERKNGNMRMQCLCHLTCDHPAAALYCEGQLTCSLRRDCWVWSRHHHSSHTENVLCAFRQTLPHAAIVRTDLLPVYCQTIGKSQMCISCAGSW